MGDHDNYPQYPEYGPVHFHEFNLETSRDQGHTHRMPGAC
jgi:hypothetical protein